MTPLLRLAGGARPETGRMCSWNEIRRRTPGHPGAGTLIPGIPPRAGDAAGSVSPPAGPHPSPVRSNLHLDALEPTPADPPYLCSPPATGAVAYPADRGAPNPGSGALPPTSPSAMHLSTGRTGTVAHPSLSPSRLPRRGHQRDWRLLLHRRETRVGRGVDAAAEQPHGRGSGPASSRHLISLATGHHRFSARSRADLIRRATAHHGIIGSRWPLMTTPTRIRIRYQHHPSRNL